MSEGSILAFLSYAWTILHEKKKTPSLSAITSLKFDAILGSANKLQVLHVIGSQGHQNPGQYSIPSSILGWLTRPLTMPFEFFARSLSGISTARCLISFKKLTH